MGWRDEEHGHLITIAIVPSRMSAGVCSLNWKLPHLIANCNSNWRRPHWMPNCSPNWRRPHVIPKKECEGTGGVRQTVTIAIGGLVYRSACN